MRLGAKLAGRGDGVVGGVGKGEWRLRGGLVREREIIRVVIGG